MHARILVTDKLTLWDHMVFFFRIVLNYCWLDTFWMVFCKKKNIKGLCHFLRILPAQGFFCLVHDCKQHSHIFVVCGHCFRVNVPSKTKIDLGYIGVTITIVCGWVLCNGLLVLVPRLPSNPAQILVRLVRSDFYASSLGGANRLLDGLHQVLSVSDQHFSGLVIFFGACNLLI